MKKLLLLAPLLLAACPDVKTDPGEGPGDLGASGPTAEFDPANSVVPFPNNLILDPATGKVNLPEQCNEGPAAKALRTGVINKLDGFGTYEVALQFTFTAAVDPATAADNVVLLERKKGADLVASPTPIKLAVLSTATTKRAAADCMSSTDVNQLVMVPLGPLDSHSTYDVAVLDGLKTTDGKAFSPSLTWALVRQKEEPVTLDAQGNVVENHTPITDKATIQGLDLLWKAHATPLAFLSANGHDPANILVASEFTTQTTTDVLDPTVPGSLANAIVGSAPLIVQDVKGPAQIVLHSAFIGLTGSDQCQQPYDDGAGHSFPGGGAIPCQAVGHIDAAVLGSKQYQSQNPNPLTGGNPVPGQFADPIHPTSTKEESLQALVVVPAGTMPTGGWPTLVFGHGLGSSKESAVVIASQIAAAGIQAIAIDFVAHGSRAVLIDNSAANKCDSSVNAGAGPDPTKDHQCFAPPLSVDLGATRDNIRQTVLDLQQVVADMKFCGLSNCGAIQVDSSRIFYAGISLGGIIGSTTFAADPDIKEAVLNVSAVGLADILENSKTNDIRCPLVDGLIDAGVLVGDKYNEAAGTGLCTMDNWKDQAGYQQFATVARWAVDPADGANFTPKLAQKKFLLQEVVDDQVVPNVATDHEGALVGLTPLTADHYTPTMTAPSAAITTNPTANKWVRYVTDSTNAFQHASLLSPVPSTAGALGTARVQTDAITFLVLNK